MEYMGLICARGGSKGIPDKNLQKVGGKPLIVRAIESAKKIDRITKVVVSTDSLEIAEISEKNGAIVPFIRPPRLAQDNSPEWAVWQHAIEFVNNDNYFPDAIVSVPPTAPLRIPADLNLCLDKYESDSPDVVLTMSKAHNNPYFNMVIKSSDSTVRIVIDSDNKVFRRQDSPDVYNITTVGYVVNSDFVLKNTGLFDGITTAVEIPIERAIDIDTPLDLALAECIIKYNGKYYE